MIIVKLIGGLGNQMFQYAAAKKLALSRGTELKLDTSEFKSRYKLRKYELGSFNIDEHFAGFKDYLRLRCFPSGLYRKTYKLFRLLGININKKYVIEKTPVFEPDLADIKGDVYLAFGYWADKAYFSGIENILRKNFTLRRELDAGNRALLADIRTAESVAIHVRRGDFIKLGAALGVDYYARAIDFIGRKIKSPTFFIFSDDIPWAKNNLKTGGRTVYVDSSFGERSAVTDMYLISQCKNQICANSTFSWWGAYLNEYPGAVKIIPKDWFMKLGGAVEL